ncbi:hypothetical protein [Methanococcoides sp.]|nr:hypothetical protein [Methanococcoides sp.]
MSMIEIRAQPGPQHQFLESTADIVLYGGTTGSGKSFCKLMELTRHTNHKGFGAVIFRHTSVQVHMKVACGIPPN